MSNAPGTSIVRKITGKKEIAAGYKIDKLDTLVKLFGGKRTKRKWKKMKGKNIDGEEIHWYEHSDYGKVGAKFKDSGEVDPFIDLETDEIYDLLEGLDR